MDKRLKSVFAILLFLVTGCQNKMEQAIINFESERYQQKVNEPVLIDEPIPFFASDSMIILEFEANQYLEKKLFSIHNQLQELLKNIEKYQAECDTITHNALKKTMLQLVNDMQKRAKTLEQIYSIYETKPEKTQLQVMYQKINSYKSDSLQLLGFKVCAAFNATQGELPPSNFQKCYLFDPSKKRITGEFTIPNLTQTKNILNY